MAGLAYDRRRTGGALTANVNRANGVWVPVPSPDPRLPWEQESDPSRALASNSEHLPGNTGLPRAVETHRQQQMAADIERERFLRAQRTHDYLAAEAERQRRLRQYTQPLTYPAPLDGFNSVLGYPAVAASNAESHSANRAEQPFDYHKRWKARNDAAKKRHANYGKAIGGFIGSVAGSSLPLPPVGKAAMPLIGRHIGGALGGLIGASREPGIPNSTGRLDDRGATLNPHP